jgi:lipoprotein NlpI
VADLVRFARQDLDETGLLAAADGAKTPLRVKQRRCEAHAYLGLFAEQAGATARAREHYQATVDTRVENYIEYQWALLRLRVLPPH